MKTTIRAMAMALCLGTTAIGAATAQSFGPAIVVNDDIITGYDIDQRARLIAAVTDGQVTQEIIDAAVDSLINDALRLQAAASRGIEPTDASIRDGFIEIAQRLGRPPGDLLRFLQSRGITQAAINEQLGAEVAWRDLLRARFGNRLSVSQVALDAEMADGATVSSEPELLLAEIRIPIGQSGRDSAVQRANSYIDRLGRGESFAALAREVSTGATARLGGDLGWQKVSALSPETRRVVATLGAGRLSTPYVEGDDVVISAVREKRVGRASGDTRMELAQLVVPVSQNATADTVGDALRRAEVARNRISDCASIETLKAEYAPISGNLGTLSTANLPATVRNAVTDLQPGQVSRPVRSSDGFHVIAVCNRAQAPVAALDEDRVRSRMLNERLERAARGLMQQLRREAVIERR